MITSELKTILDWLRWGMSRFNEAKLCFGQGYVDAWDEAIALLRFALHIDADITPELLAARLTEAERKTVHALFKKRIETRIPVAYLTNHAVFAGLDFYVDERVLIPRSPIAELIETQFEPWVEAPAVTHILDLCTGSACIAIACAHYFPDAKVDAVDISKDALEVAKINVEKQHVTDRVQLIQSDLFENLPEQKYDIIVSNPPYVSATDMQQISEEFKHEPSLGLAAGDDGLELVKRILVDAKRFLSEKGILVVEVGNSRDVLEALCPELPFVWLEFSRGGEGVFLLTHEDLFTFQKTSAMFFER